MHDAQRRLVTTHWRTRVWLICALEFRGRHRTVMALRAYTELFFLDEAVALVAGHHPCAECRRPAFRAFVTAWAGASGNVPRAGALDAVFHEERVARFAGQALPRMSVRELPFGAFFLRDGGDRTPWVVLDGIATAWSHAGYTEAIVLPEAQAVEVLTPDPTLLALRAGYRPAVHPSAGALAITLSRGTYPTTSPDVPSHCLLKLALQKQGLGRCNSESDASESWSLRRSRPRPQGVASRRPDRLPSPGDGVGRTTGSTFAGRRVREA